MLEEQVAALREEQGQTNKRLGNIEDVLTEILSAIREGGLPPAPSVAVAVDNTADEAPTEQAASEPDPIIVEATVEDVRSALMDYRDTHGKDATVQLMSQFLPNGAKPIVSEIPEAKFGDLIAAAQAEEKAAA